MNTNIIYYQRSIHEFNTWTTPLSLIELGAFTKLIDYLILNQTLPNTDRKYFLLNIKKKPEKAALDFVIKEFCFINDNGDLESEIANNIVQNTIKKSIKATINGQKGNDKLAEIRNKNVDAVATLKEKEKEKIKLNIKEKEKEITHTKQNNISNNSSENSQNLCVVNSTNSVKNNSLDTATQICINLRKSGLATVNPSYPKLQKAVELGATPEMFVNAYNDLKAQNKTVKNPFPYIVATIINQITEAHSITIKANNFNNNSTRNRPKFTQQQRSDIIAKMSNLEITNRPYLSVLLENGYTPELKENNDLTFTFLTIEEMQQKYEQNLHNKVIDVTATIANNNADLFQLADK